MTTDEKYMKEALRQARKALALGEVPIGCVIVYEERIIARGYNRRNTDKNTLSHAELNAIRKASRVLDDWRLENCTMYITLEPCQMCAGAIVQARIPRVVIGSMNPKAGCAGSVLNILQMDAFNHQVEITRGVLLEECSGMLSGFFKEMREKQRQANSAKAFLRRFRNQLPGYTVEEGREELLDDIYALMLGNTYYYEHVLGGAPVWEDCREDLEITPPNTPREKKTYAVLYKKGKCVAILDFVEDYPEEKTGFIGFFMLAGDIHGKGIGTKLLKHLSDAAAAVGMKRLRLGCYENNEIGLAFWKKQGFEAVKTHTEGNRKMLVLEKCLGTV